MEVSVLFRKNLPLPPLSLWLTYWEETVLVWPLSCFLLPPSSSSSSASRAQTPQPSPQTRPGAPWALPGCSQDLSPEHCRNSKLLLQQQTQILTGQGFNLSALRSPRDPLLVTSSLPAPVPSCLGSACRLEVERKAKGVKIN